MPFKRCAWVTGSGEGDTEGVTWMARRVSWSSSLQRARSQLFKIKHRQSDNRSIISDFVRGNLKIIIFHIIFYQHILAGAKRGFGLAVRGFPTVGTSRGGMLPLIGCCVLRTGGEVLNVEMYAF